MDVGTSDFRLDFRILGPLEIWEGPVRLSPSGAKQRGLLAVLLVSANRVVAAERLVSILWGDEPPETAWNTLQVYVSHVRRALEPDRERGAQGEILVTRPPGYELAIPDHAIDARRFERLAEEGIAMLPTDPDGSARVLRAALAEWRGPALGEFTAMPFALAEADRLEERRLACVEKRVEADLALGQHEALVAELEALVRDHPLRERMRAHLMLALYRGGRQADALRTCSDLRQRLVEELGIDPSPALRALERAILTQDPSLMWRRDAGMPAAPLVRVGSGASFDIAAVTGHELVALNPERTRLGRDPSNDIVLEGDSLVSRQHAEVVHDVDGWELRDRGSSNGTYVNGERIGEGHRLRDGDELRLGQTRLHFRLTRADAATLKPGSEPGSNLKL